MRKLVISVLTKQSVAIRGWAVGGAHGEVAKGEQIHTNGGRARRVGLGGAAVRIVGLERRHEDGRSQKVTL